MPDYEKQASTFYLLATVGLCDMLMWACLTTITLVYCSSVALHHKVTMVTKNEKQNSLHLLTMTSFFLYCSKRKEGSGVLEPGSTMLSFHGCYQSLFPSHWGLCCVNCGWSLFTHTALGPLAGGSYPMPSLLCLRSVDSKIARGVGNCSIGCGVGKDKSFFGGVGPAY